jgi:hypothetical protein
LTLTQAPNAAELGRSARRRSVVEVAWVPGWYELDPPLEVGLADEFAFWRVRVHEKCQNAPPDLRGMDAF